LFFDDILFERVIGFFNYFLEEEAVGGNDILFWCFSGDDCLLFTLGRDRSDCFEIIASWLFTDVCADMAELHGSEQYLIKANSGKLSCNELLCKGSVWMLNFKKLHKLTK